MPSIDAVWITGIGTANPLGLDGPTTMARMLAGVSGIRAAEALRNAETVAPAAGLIPSLSAPADFTADDFGRLDPIEQLLLHCCAQALADAGTKPQHGRRIGLVLGLGSEWMERWEWQRRIGLAGALMPQNDDRPSAQVVAAKLGCSGPVISCAAACASSNHALAIAKHLIERGAVDACLAGGVDRPVNATALASLDNLGVMSKRSGDHPRASRPFDRTRDGLVIGEGGAMFVLESAGRARQRGAQGFAQLLGFGSSSDCHHMVIPSPDPAPAAQAMRQAFADARVNPTDVDYVNAHATATPVGDRHEAQVLRSVFGSRIDEVPVSATKSMTGHTLSAAAAIDLLACLAAIQQQAVPPTINLEDPDPECQLLHVACEAQPRTVRTVVSNSFGFGGSNTCLVVRKVA